MNWFDAYEEVYAAVERFVEEHGTPPKEVIVSTTLYTWLVELQRERAMLSGDEAVEPVVLDTPYGVIPVVIDELLDPFEILPA